MKKSLYIHIFYCLFRFSSTICATDYDGEKLYIIEIFNADPAKKRYTRPKWFSSPTEEGFVLIVSSKITWSKFKDIIYKKVGMKIEDRFTAPVYGKLNIPTSGKKIVSPEGFKNTFHQLLEHKKPLWNYPQLFNELDFIGLKKDRLYRFAAKKFSQIKRLEESEALGKSIIPWLGANNFKLISIDDYHKWRKDPSTISFSELSSVPNQDILSTDGNAYSSESMPEANIPQLTQTNPVNQSSAALNTQNILVLPVVAGSLLVGHNRFFSQKKTEKPKKEENTEDDTDLNEIIVA